MAIEVERATGTKTIANLWRRAASRTGTAYMVETDGEWREISWEEALDGVASQLLRVRAQYGNAAILDASRSGSLSVLHGRAAAQRLA